MTPGFTDRDTVADLAETCGRDAIGSLSVYASAGDVRVFRNTESLEQAIGILAVALSHLLDRRAALEVAALDQLPAIWR